MSNDIPEADEVEYRQFFENALEGMLLVSLDGKVLRANQAIADIAGQDDPSEVIGRSVFEFVDDTVRVEIEARLSQRATTGQRGTHDTLVTRADGSVRHVRYSASPVTDEFGEIVSVIYMSMDLTDQVSTKQDLLYQSTALDAVGEAVVAFDSDLLITHWNPAATAMFGYTRHEAIGRRITEMARIDVDDEKAALAEIGATLRAGKVWNAQVPLLRRDGSSFPAYASDSPILDANGEYIAGIGVVIDMTDQVEAERQAQLRAHAQSAIAAFAEEALTFYEVDTVIDRASQVAATATHSTTAAVLLCNDDDQLIVRSVADAEGEDRARWSHLVGADVRDLGDRVANFALRALRADSALSIREPETNSGDQSGQWPVSFCRAVAALVRIKGLPRGLVVALDYDEHRTHDDVVDMLRSVASITAAAMFADEQRVAIEEQAVLDPVTGLANRVLFNDRLSQALRRSDGAESSVAVALCDIDAFESVNREFGELAGDRLLEILGDRLSGVLARNDTLARVGSDQFAVLHEVESGVPRALQLAERLSDAVSAEPFQIGGEVFQVTIGTGVTIAGGGEESSVSILAQATDALQRAKGRGRNETEVYDEELRARLDERSKVARELRGAVGRGELRLHFQPQVPTDDGEIAVEALVRWQRSDGRLSPPGEFLELGHEIGVSDGIDDWVLHTAIEQMSRWNAHDGPGPSMVAINLSVAQLNDSDRTVSTVERLLAQHGVDARSVWFEVTETQVFADLDSAVRVLHQLEDLGCGIALDDFGTGFSSLTFVRQLPTNALKIDRSFVSGLGANLKDQTIVRMVIDLARSLGLYSVAEGVETVEQQATLTALGCDYLQGYLFSPALPADALADWFENYHSTGSGHQPRRRVSRTESARTPSGQT